MVKLPGAGEDATPFLLKCYVKSGSFRPLNDFDFRSMQDEFKLYVWRSASLRDIAGLLHMRDPSLSLPNTTHSFRIVFFDTRRGVWAAREAGKGVTRISRSTFEDALDEVVSSKQEGDLEQSQLFRKTVERIRPRMSPEADDDMSRTTLEDLNFMEGDLLDVVIKSSSPSIPDKTIRIAGQAVPWSKIDSRRPAGRMANFSR